MRKELKILIVDDNKYDVMLLKHYIKKSLSKEFKYHFIMCKKAEVALDILKREPIDLVFIDFILPAMDGFEFLQTMKKNKDNTKTVFITGHHNKHIREDAIGNGAEFYINKNDLNSYEFDNILKAP